MARYWLSYDLGLRGNYDQIYEWLDRHKARECGDSLATFVSNKTFEQIERELKKLVDKSARIYLIGKPKTKSFVGRFILGKRKRSPWEGYAEIGGAGSEDEA